MTTYIIKDNEQYKSKEVYFDGKPDEKTREALKGLRFKWHGVKKCWYGFATVEEINAACDGSRIENNADTSPVKGQTLGTPQEHVKFFWNGLKIDGGELVRTWYDLNKEGGVRICARDYVDLPRDLFNVRNDTDFYSDYFEKDRTIVTPDHVLYKYVFYVAMKQAAHTAKAQIKRYEKLLGDHSQKIAEERETISKFEALTDPGQPTAEDLAQIDMQRQEEENARQAAEHAEELARRERLLNRRANGRLFIEEIAQLHPITEGEPTVEIPFSEDPAFYSWTTSKDRTMITITTNPDGTTTKEEKVIEPKRNLVLSVTAADLVLYHFDMIDPAGEGYFKTDFVIRYNDPETGEESTYSGRYDLGDRDGGLYEHIRKFGEWYLTHDKYGHPKAEPDKTNNVVEFAAFLKQFIA